MENFEKLNSLRGFDEEVPDVDILVDDLEEEDVSSENSYGEVEEDESEDDPDDIADDMDLFDDITDY